MSAIDAGVMTVMASYSSWQGVKMHGNASLLTAVLKGRLGFEGFVVGDWNGHGQIQGCSSTNCAAALSAGIDMYMAPDGWKELFDHTLAQLRAGAIPLARLDDAVRRILRVKVKLGLFEAAAARGRGGSDVLGFERTSRTRARAVRESLVLLKNQRAGAADPRRGARTGGGRCADDIGRQCGGWTLGWQGGGHSNSDFPAWRVDLRGNTRRARGRRRHSATQRRWRATPAGPRSRSSCSASTPYAESAGDLRSIEYQAGERRELALLQRLRAEHIPVVSVFLSGRPLAVDAEIDASDAFVAALASGLRGRRCRRPADRRRARRRAPRLQRHAVVRVAGGVQAEVRARLRTSLRRSRRRPVAWPWPRPRRARANGVNPGCNAASSKVSITY